MVVADGGAIVVRLASVLFLLFSRQSKLCTLVKDLIEARGHELKDWVAVSHVEQGVHDHVHVVAVTSHCLRKEDMPAMQEAARDCLEASRELDRGLEFDDLSKVVDKQLELEQELTQERALEQSQGWDMEY
jgi:hypothetical protein